MFKRIVCFLSAVIVATSSVFAWDAYSFTGVYDVASSPPVLYADSVSDNTSSVLVDSSIGSWFPLLSVSDMGYSYIGLTKNQTMSFPGTGIDDITINGVHLPFFSIGKYPSSGVATTYFEFRNILSSSFTVDPDDDNIVVNSISSTTFLPTANSSGSNSSSKLYINLDLSSFSAFSVFELDGSFRLWSYIWQNGNTYLSRSFSGAAIGLYVDGALIHTFYGDSSGIVDFNHYVYNGTSNVSSIVFSVYCDPAVYVIQDENTVLTGLVTGYYFDTWSLSLYSIGDLSALQGNINQSQNDINDHESMESQWTGSMSSNFDALDMDSFSFPSGLLSGFSLITGIFQDLWNGMGDYKILYVFPLFLGIALLLIGRISKFSGGQSSSRSNRGDDDA